MNSSRLGRGIVAGQAGMLEVVRLVLVNVRFGSGTDIRAASPMADREEQPELGFPATEVSIGRSRVCCRRECRMGRRAHASFLRRGNLRL